MPKDPVAGIDYFQQGCTLGSGPACSVIGETLADDRPEEALAHLVRACDQDIARACVRAAQLVSKDDWHTLDRDASLRGARLLERACALGESRACTARAWLSLGDSPILDDLAVGWEFAYTACMAMDLGGCSMLHALSSQHGAAIIDQAAGGWRRACIGGEMRSCRMELELRLTVSYFRTGERGTVDKPLRDAAAIVLADCLLGSLDSCAVTGRFRWFPGFRVNVFPPPWTPLIDNLCEQGHQLACASYLSNTILLRSTSETLADGIRRTTQMCDRGMPRACTVRDVLQARASAEPLSVEAHQRMEDACSEGLTEACIRVGLSLDTGAPVPISRERAQEVSRSGCMAGCIVACMIAGDLAMNSSPPVDESIYVRRVCRFSGGQLCPTVPDPHGGDTDSPSSRPRSLGEGK